MDTVSGKLVKTLMTHSSKPEKISGGSSVVETVLPITNKSLSIYFKMLEMFYSFTSLMAGSNDL